MGILIESQKLSQFYSYHSIKDPVCPCYFIQSEKILFKTARRSESYAILKHVSDGAILCVYVKHVSDSAILCEFLKHVSDSVILWGFLKYVSDSAILCVFLKMFQTILCVPETCFRQCYSMCISETCFRYSAILCAIL